MVVKVERADVTKEEGQKIVDRFTYLISLGLKNYVEAGGDLSILEKRKDMTFLEWYDYITAIKEQEKQKGKTK